MTRFLSFSIGLSLLMGVVCGNLFSTTDYYATHVKTGKNITISQKKYNELLENSNGTGYYFKETSFNLSIFAQTSVAAFSLSLIGYTLLKKNKTQ